MRSLNDSLIAKIGTLRASQPWTPPYLQAIDDCIDIIRAHFASPAKYDNPTLQEIHEQMLPHEVSDTEVLEGAYSSASDRASYWKDTFLALKKATEPASVSLEECANAAHDAIYPASSSGVSAAPVWEKVAKASGITLEDAAKSEVDLQALFRAFVKSIQGTANWQLSQHHMPGQIVIPEEEIEYWLKYIPPHSSTVRESGDRDALLIAIKALQGILDAERNGHSRPEGVRVSRANAIGQAGVALDEIGAILAGRS